MPEGAPPVVIGPRLPDRWRVVPGCLWSHGCSGRRRARPPARLGPHFVRCRASKPARALRSLRRPTHQWGRAAPWAAARPLAVRAASSARCVVSLSGQALPLPTGTAARPCGPSGALHAGGPGCLKPPSPLLACIRVGLKPPSPLRVRNGLFWCSFWAQWCCWFQRRHVVAPIGPAPRSCGRRGARGWLRWGFCAMRSPLMACRRRVGALDGVITPDSWQRGRESRRCGRQSADPLGEKR